MATETDALSSQVIQGAGGRSLSGLGMVEANLRPSQIVCEKEEHVRFGPVACRALHCVQLYRWSVGRVRRSGRGAALASTAAGCTGSALAPRALGRPRRQRRRAPPFAVPARNERSTGPAPAGARGSGACHEGVHICMGDGCQTWRVRAVVHCEVYIINIRGLDASPARATAVHRVADFKRRRTPNDSRTRTTVRCGWSRAAAASSCAVRAATL